MIRWGNIALAALLTLSIWTGTGAPAKAAAPEIKVVLDNVPLPFATPPLINNGVTFVPFRTLAQSLGVTVQWDNGTKTVHAQAEVNGAPKRVALTLGQSTARVDGQAVQLLEAPMMRNNQVLIPLNFFSSQFGAKVSWTQSTRTVTVVSPQKEMHLRTFYALGSYGQRARMADMNSVAFGWSRINDQGEIVLDGADYFWPAPAGEDTPESIIAGVAAEGITPYLMVYSVDGRGELTKMLSDPVLRNKALDGIVELAVEKGFEGVQLDLEGLGLQLDPVAQQRLLNHFVEELHTRLTPLGIGISIAVPPPNGWYKGYDYVKLASLAEDLVLMAYDYRPDPNQTRAPEPNASVDQAIRQLLEMGVPKEKIVLGIHLWNETPATVGDKLGLAKRYGLKGAAFWRLTFHNDAFAEAIGRSAIKSQ